MIFWITALLITQDMASGRALATRLENASLFIILFFIAGPTLVLRHTDTHTG